MPFSLSKPVGKAVVPQNNRLALISAVIVLLYNADIFAVRYIVRKNNALLSGGKSIVLKNNALILAVGTIVSAYSLIILVGKCFVPWYS